MTCTYLEKKNCSWRLFLTLPSDSCSEIVTVPGLIGHGFPPAYNWNFTTTRQEFLDNRTRDYGQGHVVGGGSILNGIVMTRGTVADYNAWEALGNPGWGWKGLLPYFKKVSIVLMLVS